MPLRRIAKLVRIAAYRQMECMPMKSTQPDALADAVVMVRASRFGANPETRASNAFQTARDEADASARAMDEQIVLAESLESAGIAVLMLEPPSRSPDGVFPNNWFSTHADGTLVLYPMEAPSRRSERIPGLAQRFTDAGFTVNDIVDLTLHADEGRYLEGTGSLVLDRANRIAYACTSSRTDATLAAEWAARFGFRLCAFRAADPAGRAIYHTNVIMSLGAGLAIICLDAIAAADRERVRNALTNAGQEILVIRWEQVLAFAGNQLFLQGRDGPVITLSRAADTALDAAQKALMDRHGRRMSADIATIERLGGGSVRCMLAENFLPRPEHIK